MKWAIKFCYHLWGLPFEVVMDHAPLQWLSRMKDINTHLVQ